MKANLTNDQRAKVIQHINAAAKRLNGQLAIRPASWQPMTRAQVKALMAKD